MSQRPDSFYWKLSKAKRGRITEEQRNQINKQLAEYSKKRFKLGRKFRLTCDYWGVPKGTQCLVISVWPDTRVKWDRWGGKGSYGARSTRIATMSYELDICLTPVD